MAAQANVGSFALDALRLSGSLQTHYGRGEINA